MQKIKAKDRLQNYLNFCFQNPLAFKGFWKQFSVSYFVTIPKLQTLTSDDLIFYFVALTFFLLPTGTAPPIISISIATIIWIVSGKFTKIPSIVKQSWFWPVIPFLILPWIGLLYSQNLELGLDYALKIKYWLVSILVASLAINEKKIIILLKWFWIGLLSGAVLAAMQFVGLVEPIDIDHMGYGIVHTLISLYLIIGLLTVSFCFQTERNFETKIVYLILIIFFLFHLAILRGRGGYLFFVLLSPMIAHNLLYDFSFKLKAIVAVFIVGTLLLSPVVRTVIGDTYNNLQDQKEKILAGEDTPIFPRFYIYKETIHHIKSNFFGGIGTGSLTEYTKERGRMIHHPHNSILYMWVSFGVLGFLSFLWLFYNMIKLSWVCRKTVLGYFILSCGVVLFLGGLFDTQILNTGTLIFLSLSYGLINHLPKTVSSEDN